MVRIRDAYSSQLGEDGSLTLSSTQDEAECRIATWESLVAHPDWDAIWPIMQIMCLDYTAMAHLDRCRWGASPVNRSRALEAWRIMMSAYPENMAMRTAYLHIDALPSSQPLSVALLEGILAGSGSRVELPQPPTQRMAVGYAGEPLRAIPRISAF